MTRIRTEMEDGSIRLSGSDFVAVLPALFFAATAIVGAILWFSPVPFWDMWDGTVVFHFQRQTDGLNAFFGQANEHRILWSKILFWADDALIGGMNYLLITANVVLMIAIWATFAICARQLGSGNRRAAFLAAMLIALPCFSWLQAENINWGYQSQFFLAYLLPLLALLSMGQWMRSRHSSWYIGSVVLGIASSLTMANGLLALPLLIAMMLLNRRWHIGQLLGLTAITVATIGLWLLNYRSTVHAPAPFVEKAKFILAFLGAPGAWILQSHTLSMVLGACVILAGMFFAFMWLRGETREPSYAALLLFLLYIGGAAAAAASGRASGGYQNAFAGRYETPVMLAYASIALMTMHLGRNRASTSALLTTLLAATTVVLLPTQLQAINGTGTGQVQAKALASQALNLGVRDNAATQAVYPSDTPDRVDHIHRIAQKAISDNYGVFAQREMRMAREALGKSPTQLSLERCTGDINTNQPVAGDERYVKVTGWAFNQTVGRIPPLAFLVSNGRVAGVGFTGIDRPDVARAVSSKAARSGFQGYTLSASAGDLQIYCSP
ncbi:MAG: hypothetical protein QHC88_13110 [Achromobacter sp.]|uniref:hypothetical protein n=1 Tax=Achromobacter sp. TaxID=134375 RepID=UPI0029A1C4A3|nr:hypothetical protein [Achromobacter sp.]MDX3986184.1 hypothetical protein [Achromobacter sp.]